MAELGAFAVVVALVASAWAAVAGALAHRRGREAFLRSAEGALWGALLALTVALGILAYLFLARDFSVESVAQYSDTTLSPVMTVAAVWAGQEGSLLLWTWMLGGTAALVPALHRRRHPALLPAAVAVVAVVLVLFTALVAVASNPFTRLDFVPSEGAGLNPMLIHWAQVLHPPATFLGYVGFTVPFAFALAALATGRLDSEWLRASRPWMIAAWILLGIGIVLGARWAYTELGWGGYWAWDPVENVSLLPWLIATVFLHTAVLQERRGKLRVANLVAAIAAFVLTLFATFLVRSGVAASVHAFAESPAGRYFLVAIVLAVVVAAGLVSWRLPRLRDRGARIGGLSRETLLVLTAALLVAYTLVILWGTLFPVLASAVQGRELSVDPPFFDAVSVPVAVLLLALLGPGPLVGWRRTSHAGLRRGLVAPAAAALVAGAVAAIVDAGRSPVTVAVTALAAFALAGIVIDLSRGVRDGRARELGSLAAVRSAFARHPRRYGGAVAHLGIVVLVVGLALDGAYRVDDQLDLALGEATTFEGYTVTLAALDTEAGMDRSALTATLEVERDGSRVGALSTERYLEGRMEQPRTEVGVLTRWHEDLYAVLGDVDVEAQVAQIELHRHPGLLWIWVGSVFTLLGGLLAVWPYRRHPAGEPTADRVRGRDEASALAGARGQAAEPVPAGGERSEGVS